MEGVPKPSHPGMGLVALSMHFRLPLQSLSVSQSPSHSSIAHQVSAAHVLRLPSHEKVVRTGRY